MSHWLNSLGPEDRKAALGEMNLISKKWEYWNASYDRLKPRAGEIPVGGTHIDSFVKAEALWEFNSAIGKGKTPQEARDSANKVAEKVLASWNRSRKDYQVHRWVKGEESFIFGATLDLIKLANRIAESRSAESVA